MAEKKKAEAEVAVEVPEGAASAKPKKKGKLLIIIITLTLLAGGGGGAWWFMKAKTPQDPKAATQKKSESEKPPIYVRLDAFPVNLKKVDAEGHLLQVAIQFKVEEPKAEAAVKLRMPEIQNALLLLLSNKTQEELSTVEGKQKLSSDIVSQVNQIIHAKEPTKDGVVGVYFTSFVMQ